MITGWQREVVRVAVVLNPRGGGGRGRRAAGALGALLAAAGLTVEERRTRCPGHATQIAQELLARDDPPPPDALCVLGGDGTIHEVVNGSMALPPERRAPLGIVPGGSGNSLAHDLGCLDVRDAARRIAAGARRPLDLMHVVGDGWSRYAFNVVGWGMAADTARLAESLRWIGAGRYRLAAMLAVATSPMRGARLEATAPRGGGSGGGSGGGGGSAVREREDTVVAAPLPTGGRFALVIACNTQHTGAGMRIAPAARLDDGLVDVVAVDAVGRARLLSLLGRIGSGRHLDAQPVHHAQVTRLSLSDALGLPPGAARRPLNIDGELVGRAPFALHVVPRALELLA